MARPWARATTTGATVVVAGVTAHRLGGGHAVTPLFVAFLMVAAVATVRLLQGAPGSWLRTALLLAAGQATVHALLTLSHRVSSGHAGHAVSASAGVDHGHDALRRAGSALGPHLIAGTAEGFRSLLDDPAMMVAHSAAAVALAAWLAAGERAAVAVVRMIAAVARQSLPRPGAHVVSPAPLAPVGPGPVGPVPARVFARTGRRRGPPRWFWAPPLPV